MDIDGARPGGNPRKQCPRVVGSAHPDQESMAGAGTPPDRSRPELRAAYRKYNRTVTAQSAAGFAALLLCKKAPKRWADNVDTTGSFCQMAHFDGGYRSAVSGGIASVHTLMLDLDCLEGGVTADGQKCRRWPTEGPGVSVPTTS